jgi:hypothetical protein
MNVAEYKSWYQERYGKEPSYAMIEKFKQIGGCEMDYKAEYDMLLIQHQELTTKYNKLFATYREIIKMIQDKLEV